MSEGVYFPDCGIVIPDKNVLMPSPEAFPPNRTWEMKKQIRTGLASFLTEESNQPIVLPKHRTIDDPWRPSLDEFID